MTFGKSKVLAWRFVRGLPIPVFKDNAVNRKIDAHVDRILAAKTDKKNKGRTSVNTRRDDE
jgi:hypothetical protein